MGLRRQELNAAMTEMEDRLSVLVEAGPVPRVIYLEAGHHKVSTGPDDFSLTSLRHALDLGQNLILKYKDKVKIVFGVLKDDLGLSCDTLSCWIPQPVQTSEADLALPRSLEAILLASPVVKMDKIMIFSERNAKNRGLAHLKSLRSGKTFPSGMEERADSQRDGLFFRTWDRQSVELAVIHGDHWTAKCPTLMGQHYADVLSRLRQRFPREYPVALVDFSDIMDRNKVTRGSESFLRYFRTPEVGSGRVEVLNMFYDDPEGQYFIWEEFSSGDF